MKTRLYRFAVAALITGCANTTPSSSQDVIDGSSRASTDHTLELMQSHQTGLDQCNLRVAVRHILLSAPGINDGNNFGQKINGMSAQQIIDLSKQYPGFHPATEMCAP